MSRTCVRSAFFLALNLFGFTFADANIFIILYGILSVYFAGVMVRLILVLAPVACVLGAIGASHTLNTFIKAIIAKEPKKAKPSKKVEEAQPVNKLFAAAVVGTLALGLCFYAIHCTWVSESLGSSTL